MALFFMLNFIIESNTFVLINATHLICSFPICNGKKADHRQLTYTRIEDTEQDSPDLENQLLCINLGRLPDVMDK